MHSADFKFYSIEVQDKLIDERVTAQNCKKLILSNWGKVEKYQIRTFNCIIVQISSTINSIKYKEC